MKSPLLEQSRRIDSATQSNNAILPNRIGPPLLLCVLIGLFAFSGCSPPWNDSPPLTDSTFTRILVDLHLTTARVDRFSELPPGVSDSLFAHHGIRRTDFDATMRYYTRHPSAFESLYDAVIDTLDALQNRRRGRSSPSPDSMRKRMKQRARQNP